VELFNCFLYAVSMPHDDSLWAFLRRHSKKTAQAAVVMVSHLLLCLVFITCFWAFEKYLHFLTGNDEPKVMGVVPLKWCFDLVDVALLLTFGYCGIRESYNILKD
jgi:hypothetical protein